MRVHPVKSGILQSACSTRQKRDALLEKRGFAHRRVEEQPSKRSKKNGNKSAVAILKRTRHLGCVFQDMERPRYSSILRKSSTMGKPIQCVRFTKPYCAMPKFETKIHRSTKFAQANLISETRTLQNLRIGLRKRRNGKSIGLVKQRGGWSRKS